MAQSPENFNNSFVNIVDLLAKIVQVGTFLAVFIYTMGFIIVNAYFSIKGISVVRLVQPSFISAGIFYCAVSAWAILPASLYYLISKEFIRVFPSRVIILYVVYKYPRIRTTKRGVLVIIKLILKKVVAWKIYWVLLFCLIPIFFLAYIILSLVFGYLLSKIIYFSTVGLIAEQGITDELTLLLSAQAVFWFAVIMLLRSYFQRDSLKFRFLGLVGFALIITTQAFSLLFTAGNLYDKVSYSIGGGKPESVFLFVKKDDLEYFKTLGIQLCKISTSEHLYVTPEPLLLYWQLSENRQFGRPGEAPTPILYLATAKERPIIAIQGIKVESIMYWPYDSSLGVKRECKE